MVVEGDKEHTEVPIAFEKFIISLALLNVLCCRHVVRPAALYGRRADLADVFFTAAFTIETLKITALGLRQYLQNPWNIFDGADRLAAADLLQGLSAVASPSTATLRMLRIFRIARLLRLIKGVEGLNRLIRTIVISVPALANVGVPFPLPLHLHCARRRALPQPAAQRRVHQCRRQLRHVWHRDAHALPLHHRRVVQRHHARRHDRREDARAWPLHRGRGQLRQPSDRGALLPHVRGARGDGDAQPDRRRRARHLAEEDAAEKVKLPASQIEAFVEAWKDNDPNATHFMPTKDLRSFCSRLPPLGFKGRSSRRAT